MKRWKTIAIAMTGLAGVWAVAQTASTPRALPELVPAGPLLYLEAKDLGGLVSDWNTSAEKRQWLQSANYKVFSQSRLLLRLQEVQEQYAAAAGVAPGMNLVESVAGRESALAVYDIGRTEFLYLTRLPSARLANNLLTQQRGSYQTRNVKGKPYYLRIDPATKRVAAFATVDDYLLLATREDVLSGAVALLAGDARTTLKQERWFQDALRDAPAATDLRLVMDFSRVTRSPYFRSYWLPGNITEMQQYGAVLTDLTRTPAELRENRVLWRVQPLDAVAPPAVVPGLVSWIPEGTGLYRIWAQPSADQVVTLLRSKLLAPSTAGQDAPATAPGSVDEEAVAGHTADLDTRIDEPPLQLTAPVFSGAALQKALSDARVEGMAQVQSSRAATDGVFIGSQTAIILQAANDWNAASIRQVLADSIRPLYTTSRLGVAWTEQAAGNQRIAVLNGLLPLAAGVARGKYLVLADSPALVSAVLERGTATNAAAPGATYAARYDHGRENAPFARLMRLLDYPATHGDSSEGRPPRFFSENVASLGRVLSRVDSVATSVQDLPEAQRQTVVYRLRPPANRP